MNPSELRRLLDEATPGPWAFNKSGRFDDLRGEFRALSPHNGFMLTNAYTNAADPALIVGLRNSADVLLDVVEAAEIRARFHFFGCPDPKGECNCGLDALRAALARLGSPDG